MFLNKKRNTTKRKIKFYFKGNNITSSSNTGLLDSDEILNILREDLKTHGKLVIEQIGDDYINITTLKTISFEKTENELDNIKQILMNHISSIKECNKNEG